MSSGCFSDCIVVNDPAAILRESDWLKLYAAAPLSRIVRCVGPWRAGLERTDSQWPLSTTVVAGCLDELMAHLSPTKLPFTASYDERAGTLADIDTLPLRGTIARVVIRQSDLAAMWEDTLRECDVCILREGESTHPDRVNLVVTDRDLSSDVVWTIRLVPDPWNVSATPKQIVASVLDSPWLVLKRFLNQREGVH